MASTLVAAGTGKGRNHVGAKVHQPPGLLGPDLAGRPKTDWHQ